MKTTHIILLLIIPCFFLSMTCEKKNTKNCHIKLEFKNSSDKELLVVLSYDYPDTSINFQNPLSDYTFSGYIMPNKTDYIRNAASNMCIESILSDYSYEKVSLFIFDADVVDSIPWSQIRQHYQVLHRYDFTLDELRALGWHIDYP